MIQLGFYRHYKGLIYKTICVAKHTECNHQFVVYQSMSGNNEIWCRPLAMWKEHVMKNGKSIPRFIRISERQALDEIIKQSLG